MIVAERQSSLFLDCRVGGRTTWSAFAIECRAASVALDIHFEDGGVVDEAIDGGERHRLVREDLSPFAKGLIGGHQH